MNARALLACLCALGVHDVQAQPLMLDPAPGRDPFSPPAAPRAADVGGPLQRIPLRQLELAAVMSGAGTTRALLQDEAGAGYIVVVGSLVGNQGGIVTSIEAGRLVVEASEGSDTAGRRTVLDLYGGVAPTLVPEARR